MRKTECNQGCNVIYFLASLVGLSLGLLGAGGSILALPILRYAGGLPATHAVATSLAAVGAISLVGAIGAYGEGRVRLRKGLLFALLGSLGTVLGVVVASQVSGQFQMLAFVAVMLVAALSMLWGKEAEPKEASLGMMLFQGIGVGAITGLVGVGGGFLVVPALVLLFRLPMKEATGTSLLVSAINSLVGLVTYSQVLELDWTLAGKFTGGALLGLFVGQALSRRMEASSLHRLFGWFLLAVAGLVLALEWRA